jgi:hypothetical protein
MGEGVHERQGDMEEGQWALEKEVSLRDSAGRLDKDDKDKTEEFMFHWSL